MGLFGSIGGIAGGLIGGPVGGIVGGGIGGLIDGSLDSTNSTIDAQIASLREMSAIKSEMYKITRKRQEEDAEDFKASVEHSQALSGFANDSEVFGDVKTMNDRRIQEDLNLSDLYFKLDMAGVNSQISGLQAQKIPAWQQYLNPVMSGMTGGFNTFNQKSK